MLNFEILLSSNQMRLRNRIEEDNRLIQESCVSGSVVDSGAYRGQGHVQGRESLATYDKLPQIPQQQQYVYPDQQRHERHYEQEQHPQVPPSNVSVHNTQYMELWGELFLTECHEDNLF